MFEEISGVDKITDFGEENEDDEDDGAWSSDKC